MAASRARVGWSGHCHARPFLLAHESITDGLRPWSSLWGRLYACLAYGFARMRGDTVEFRILGPCRCSRVSGGWRSAAPGPAAVGALLMNANRVVPADVLIRELWPDLAPDRAAANFQVRLSELRKAWYGGAGRSASDPPAGYSFASAPTNLTFYGSSSSSRRAEPRSRAEILTPPRGCLTSHSRRGVAWRWLTSNFQFAGIEQARLEEERLGVLQLENRRNVGLRAIQQSPSSETLTRDHPLRERSLDHRVAGSSPPASGRSSARVLKL